MGEGGREDVPIAVGVVRVEGQATQLNELEPLHDRLDGGVGKDVLIKVHFSSRRHLGVGPLRREGGREGERGKHVEAHYYPPAFVMAVPSSFPSSPAPSLCVH